MSSDGVRLGRFLQTNASEEFNGLRGVTPQPVTIDLSAVDEDDRWEVESARLQDFNLKNCTIIGARFTRAAFGQINLDRVVFRGCIFNSCTFIAERPNDVVFEECLFEACLFDHIPFRDLRVIRCIFDEDDTKPCHFTSRCNFNGFSAKSNAFPSARVTDPQQARVLRRLLVRGITSPRPTRSKRK